MVEAGSHAQGCIFQDGPHLYSEPLRERIDQISQAVQGFYIGRDDIRYKDADQLRAGQNFTIIELNGVASEATRIYDERNSLLSAYRTLFTQWRLIFEIGVSNQRFLVNGAIHGVRFFVCGAWPAVKRKCDPSPTEVCAA